MNNIEVGIDASNFSDEMSFEIAAFKSSVTQNIAYPFHRLFTTKMLYPRNSNVVKLLEKRGNLDTAGDGTWSNIFIFPTVIEYHVLQSGRLIRLRVTVPAEVNLEIDLSKPDVDVIDFSPTWQVEILDPIEIEGNSITFREPFFLYRLNSRDGELSYSIRNRDSSIMVELSAVYDSNMLSTLDKTFIKAYRVGDIASIVKLIGIDAFKIGGPCLPVGPNPSRPSDGKNIHLHIRVVDQQNSSIDQQIQNTIQLFQNYGFNVILSSQSIIHDPTLLDIDVGRCFSGETTADQERLFSNRAGASNYEVVMFFVESTIPPYGGCAAFSDPKKPSCIVTRYSSSWTAAHELGHVLGLTHINDNLRLMTGNGTGNITNPPPDLTVSELNIIQRSNYTVAK